MERIAQLTLLPSDNFFAELLAKGMGGGTTAGGSDAVERYAHRRHAAVRLSDGSGLSRANQAPPQQVVEYLDHEADAPQFDSFFGALPIAGVDGTLADRMRSGPAHHHCHAKTGTLNQATALAGYLQSVQGTMISFTYIINLPEPKIITLDDVALEEQLASILVAYPETVDINAIGPQP
jgi:D-alanyl-D-alanine carboxypeptidase/D-alanyl-D-alanine-endopeptidase (penicillin-binding protein 4)